MIILLATLSLVMGTVLGLLGGGGSILTLPILAYIAHMPAGEAIASSLVVVAITSAVSAVMHAKQGNVQFKTGLTFGGVAMIGAYLGGRLAVFFPGWLLLAIFALLMITTSLLMLKKKKSTDEVGGTSQARPMLLAAEGLVVGAITGLIGAGGGFLVVPALALMGGLPMRQAIGTSLMIIAMKSSAGVVGHLAHVDIDWGLTLLISLFAVGGSFIGAKYSKKIPADTLRRVFAYFVLAMGTFILLKETVL